MLVLSISDQEPIIYTFSKSKITLVRRSDNSLRLGFDTIPEAAEVLRGSIMTDRQLERWYKTTKSDDDLATLVNKVRFHSKEKYDAIRHDTGNDQVRSHSMAFREGFDAALKILTEIV